MAVPPHLHQLFGACACDRNQYTITVPMAEVRRARVFLDNSTANRRAQAAPVTAWLRVPRAWYASCTVAQFEGESHALIRRTYYPPSTVVPTATVPAASRTRRHFCGFCGTHLSKAEEFDREPSESDIDVTLGSLEGESLNGLESLGVLSSEEEDDREYEEEEQEEDTSGATAEFEQRQHAAAEAAADKTAVADAADGFMKQDAMINDEDHISAMSGLGGPGATAASRPSLHQMQHRGIPYFETLVENSRLGRIKRQKGGHVSRDGSTRVQWEVVEITNEPTIAQGTATGVDDNPHKRQRRVT